MKDSLFEIELNEKEKSFDFMKLARKLLGYWPWFLISLAVALAIAFFYLRYATTMYASVAKIKVIDSSKETDIAKDPLSVVWSDSKINLDNEIAVLKSYRLLSQVVDSLNLNIVYYEVGKIMTSEVWNGPFEINNVVPNDSIIEPLSFNVELEVSGFKVTDENDSIHNIPYFQTEETKPTTLPFMINLSESAVINKYKGREFLIMLYPFQQTVNDLSTNLFITSTNKKSEVLELWLYGENATKSETILNTIIHEFNLDGIRDRQQISKRTLAFIDERFAYLTKELDSIEGGKQDFKQENNLSYIEADAGSSLTRKSEAEDEVSDLKTQISLASVLKETVLKQKQYTLLPVNIGLENVSLNASVNNYNEMALERDKLLVSVGESHPTLTTLSSQLERAKVNILKTVNVYEIQLKAALQRLNEVKSTANTIFSSLPEKEKMLRAIERQQSIKENLFLLLLQRREEAAINLAVTAPSVKVIDYGITAIKPIAPKKMLVMGLAGILGLFLPILVLYIKFAANGKIQDREDLKNYVYDIPLLTTIPHFKQNPIFKDINEQTPLAEAYRMMATKIVSLNTKNNTTDGSVIFCTSNAENEGKSLNAYNLSVGFASLDKKVLLIDVNLRNPAVHDLLGLSHKSKGLTSYLNNPSIDWKDTISSGLSNCDTHHVCLAGPIPENAPNLLSKNTFGTYIAKAKEFYDVVIVDTAPVNSVTDTLLISKYADLILYILRVEVTDNAALQTAQDLKNTQDIKQMAFVLNAVQ